MLGAFSLSPSGFQQLFGQPYFRWMDLGLPFFKWLSFLTLSLFLHLFGLVTIQYFVRLDSSLRFYCWTALLSFPDSCFLTLFTLYCNLRHSVPAFIARHLFSQRFIALFCRLRSSYLKLLLRASWPYVAFSLRIPALLSVYRVIPSIARFIALVTVVRFIALVIAKRFIVLVTVVRFIALTNSAHFIAFCFVSIVSSIVFTTAQY